MSTSVHRSLRPKNYPDFCTTNPGGVVRRMQLPGTYVDLLRAADFLLQVAEDGPEAKRSCSLTSQLNAYIATGSIDADKALEVQEELCHNPYYDSLWSPAMYGPEKNWRAWMAQPVELAGIINDQYGQNVKTPIVLADFRTHSVPEVRDHLSRGGVVYMAGKSVVASHARIAFEPFGMADRIFVHDPHYPETTGLYDYCAVERFQNHPKAILYEPGEHANQLE